LYSDAQLKSDKRTFIGLDVMRDVWDTLNYNSEWHGLLEDKLAATTLLGGFGFPTIPTRALYSETFELPAVPTFKSADELAAFLRDESQYPLFGKPSNGLQSIGSASLANYDKTTDSIVMLHGKRLAVDEFAAEVATSFADGYILQGRLDPHPDIAGLCGTRLATCRIVTLRDEDGIGVTRSLWKIPGGQNVADNFWRSGNMIGQLDPDTGTVLRVQSGAGLAATEPEAHPDTGETMIGFKIPHFEEAKALAIRAHKVFKEINLIGWDMAITANGPVIVEPNITPDFFLPQAADRTGILDDKMKALLKHYKARKAARGKANKKQTLDELRARRKRITDSALDG
ncbi:MAG: sugar-transfer associated ATP-grasp domain-containing protein, partial [Hyphomicrobiaceae bacterium]